VTVLERSEVMSVLSRPVIQFQGRSRSRAPSESADPSVIAGFLVTVEYSLLS